MCHQGRNFRSAYSYAPSGATRACGLNPDGLRRGLLSYALRAHASLPSCQCVTKAGTSDLHILTPRPGLPGRVDSIPTACAVGYYLTPFGLMLAFLLANVSPRPELPICIFLRPVRGYPGVWTQSRRLAPWATILRPSGSC